MNKKIIGIPIVIVVVIFLISVVMNNEISQTNDMDETDVVFHVTLANPELYIDGVYTESFTIKKGEYSFRFVPNGSSPEILSISLKGTNFEFEEDFSLKGTLHETGISEYFTWKYDGQSTLLIPERQVVSIVIDPNGMVAGSVSVDILEN